MAIRICPECGSQYVASVRRCIDCEVALVEESDAVEKSPTASASSAPTDGDEVAYELEGWGNQLKQTLEGMLDRAGVRRVWEASALVVAAEHEEVVDQLVATVEGADLPDLDDNSAQIAFEMEGIGPDELVDLDARLIAAGLAHAWDEAGALLVAEADEDEAEAIIQDVLDQPEEPEIDGLVTQQALSALFVAVDKLMKDPTDVKLARRYSEAVEALADLPVPYGLTGIEWDDLHDEVRALANLVPVPKAGSGVDDEDGSDDAEGDASKTVVDDDAAATGQDDGDDGAEGAVVDDEDDAASTPATERPPSLLGQAKAQARELRERLAELV